MLIGFIQALCAGDKLTACPIECILPTGFLMGLYKELQGWLTNHCQEFLSLFIYFFIDHQCTMKACYQLMLIEQINHC